MKRFIYVLLVGLTVAGTHTSAQAASSTTHQLTIQGPTTAKLGNTFIITASISAPVAINAIEGKISFPKDILEATKVSYSGSIIEFWQQTPSISQSTGTITFLGGLPNPGFTGNAGKLISVEFKAKAVARATVTFTPQSLVLLNDGNGTATSWHPNPLTIDITRSATTAPPPAGGPTPTPPVEPTPAPAASEIFSPAEEQETPKDTTPPENLELIVGRDSQLFEGSWFAVFHATDTGSGVSHYEIAEITNTQNIHYPRESDWKKVVSPFKLSNQTVPGKIFLKAVDNSNNSSVTSQSFPPRKTTVSWYLWLVILLLIVICILLWFILKRRKKEEVYLNKLNNTVQK